MVHDNKIKSEIFQINTGEMVSFTLSHLEGSGPHDTESSVVVSVVSMRGASTVLYATVGCLALFLVVVSGLAAYNHRRHVANKAGRRRVNG